MEDLSINPGLQGNSNLKRFSSSNSGESDDESSSFKAGGFPITESEPFPDPKTGVDSFGGQALCWYENPPKRAHDFAENHGVEPEELKVEIISSSTSAECGEGFTSPKLEICQARSRPNLRPNHSERTDTIDAKFLLVLMQPLLGATVVTTEYSVWQTAGSPDISKQDYIVRVFCFCWIFAAAVLDLVSEIWMEKKLSGLSLFAAYFTFSHLVSAVNQEEATEASLHSYSGMVLATIILIKHCAAFFRYVRNWKGHED